jgi:hypothetical protein
MDLSEFATHSFIIRIWREEIEEEAGQATWRGHITHVPGGERRYLRSLGDIAAFIAPYIEEMGVGVGPRGRIRQFLERWLSGCPPRD